MFQRRYFLVLLIIGMILFGGGPFPLLRASSLQISPPRLDITTFFSGRSMSLTGAIPADRDVILEIKGPEEKSVFNMKGRVGPFWMNRGKVELENAPFLYLLLLPDGKAWHGPFSAFGVGIDQLEKGMVSRPNNVSLDVVFPRFVKLKQSEHLYDELPNAVHYGAVTDGLKHFEAAFHFPSSILPGQYRILTRVIHDGKVEQKILKDFEVREVGFIKTVRELAYDRALLYGILCVLIALFVGALIGLVFKGGGAH